MVEGLRRYYIFTMKPGSRRYYLMRSKSTHRYTRWSEDPTLALKFETRESALQFYEELKEELRGFNHTTLVEVYRGVDEEDQEVSSVPLKRSESENE